MEGVGDGPRGAPLAGSLERRRGPRGVVCGGGGA
jgi:hypothetical protein